MDWETFSEAGYVYYPDEQKWRSLLKNKNGLEAVGMAVYAQHPTTEVLCLAYHLPGGKGTRRWKPGDPPPTDLIEWHNNGGEIEAHNSGFEFYIWYFVMYARMGWPLPNQSQFRCSMAKARAYSLPGGLDKIGEILRLPEELKKNRNGKLLINKLSIPRAPTKTNPALRLYPHTAPELFQEFYGYNEQDVSAEMAVSDLIPELTPDELELWLLDQRINIRGVCIDRPALDACISIIEQATVKYEAELVPLTGGQVQTVSEVQKITKWLAKNGTYVHSLEAEEVEITLARADLPPVCRRVLEIRAVLASASVKKVFAISRQLGFDDRLRELFAFCGADRTGRFAGRGPQPQNLYKGGPDVRRCDGDQPGRGLGDVKCKALYWKKLNHCPVCGTPEQFSNPDEWGVDGIELALEHIATRNLDYVEMMWGDPFNVVAGCLRGLFVAAPGADLMASDFSAIEAVVLAVLAGEEWRLEVFRTHGKIYETTLAMITGIPFQEILDFRTKTKKHHPLRNQFGKIPELACFGSDTQVLTDSGWKRIVDISIQDKLFDGCEFVNHGGVVSRGNRLTTILGGVIVTPDHKFFIGGIEWATAGDLKENTPYLNRAKCTANSLLSAALKNLQGGLSQSNASVLACALYKSPTPTYYGARQRVATHAQRKPRVKLQHAMTKDALIKNTVEDFLTELARLYRAAQSRITSSIRFTGAAALQYAPLGVPIKISGSNTYVPYQDGITPTQQWTASKTIVGTRPVTSDLLRTASNKIINGRQYGFTLTGAKCLPLNFTKATRQILRIATLLLESLMPVKPRKKLSNSPTTEVFDVINCGPRNRFTILTDDGPLIAHNSGFQGSVGAWKQFGADEYMTDEEILANVRKWRAASPMIVEFWYNIEEAARMAIQNPGKAFKYRDITYEVANDILHCLLPSGRILYYWNPELVREKVKRMTSKAQDSYEEMIAAGWNDDELVRHGLMTIRIRLKITYMGNNSDIKKGPKGWMRLDTYGGKLTENIVQAVARDILAYSMKNLDAAGYSIVMHVHDEPVSEVLKGTGSIQDFERIMSILPPWAAGWPLKVGGGWRGRRYRKD